MKNVGKYAKRYFLPPEPCFDWVKKDFVDHAPVWCSVDLRDGNQALVVPMSLEQKLEFFTLLCKIGFKEIEIGFPAASETEYEFCRALIERGLIPDDVTIQVLTQSREHIIKKTFKALEGAKHAVVHLYNSTSVAQRKQVFRKEKPEIIEIAVKGAELLLKEAKETKGNFTFEYSPESFTGTEPEFALEICNAVLDVWKPASEKKVIINLPVTVEESMPHVYAQQIEYMCKHLKYRENVLVSTHPHNDRGCAVADAEFALLAGADRVEGTLFGNGERTGNVDIVTLALNMFSQGVDPGLDFTNMPALVEEYERFTDMKVNPRQPYGGALVFAAFSGSHQDAIAKGMKYHEEKEKDRWTVPYLPIDPKDVGRQYDGDVIRINSQSGKGGIGYLLETRFGINLPAKMREDLGYKVKSVSDHRHKELSPDEVKEIFEKEYVNLTSPIKVVEHHYKQVDGNIDAVVTLEMNGERKVLEGFGNGRLNAVNEAIKSVVPFDYHIETYQEHALTRTSKSLAVSYVALQKEGEDKLIWGAGVHSDIIVASVNALVSALNNMLG